MTYSEIRKNEEVLAFIKKGNANLGAMGFTDHSEAHSGLVAERAAVRKRPKYAHNASKARLRARRLFTVSLFLYATVATGLLKTIEPQNSQSEQITLGVFLFVQSVLGLYRKIALNDPFFSAISIEISPKWVYTKKLAQEILKIRKISISEENFSV